MLILILALSPPGPAAAQQVADCQASVVGGVVLGVTSAAGWPLYCERGVEPGLLAHAAAALGQALDDVPRLSGLPALQTPLAVYLLADQERFRLALAEVANVRVELVANEVGGYTIERSGTMLVFLPAAAVERPASAALLFSQELAHLAVREASERKPVPQWFNEGYADWIATTALRERFPEEAAIFEAISRAMVASAQLSRGRLLPWSDLVTRTRFSQAGLEGLGGLAYAQSTLFVDWLAQRHGNGAVARFLVAISRELSVTRAFESTMGAFAPQAEAYAAWVASVAAELGPGLHRFSARVEQERPLLFGVVGGTPGEAVTVELEMEGAPDRRRERTLDEAGFLPILLDEATMAQPSRRLIRVSSTSLGVLEAEVVVGAEVQPAPRPAPVQLPKRGRIHDSRPLIGCSDCSPGSWDAMSAA